MNNYLNFKIVGSGPSGLLLAISLAKLNFNIYITDLLTREKLINKDKTYAITHSTRKILSKFNLWSKLKSYLYKFDSLSISDSVTSDFTILTTSDLDKDICSLDTIGWVVKHSDLMNVFFDEVDNVDNIFFKSPLDLSFNDIKFDYEFEKSNKFERHFYWLKIKMLVDNLEKGKHEFYLWLDADTFFCRYENILNHIDKSKHIFVHNNFFKSVHKTKYKFVKTKTKYSWCNNCPLPFRTLQISDPANGNFSLLFNLIIYYFFKHLMYTTRKSNSVNRCYINNS